MWKITSVEIAEIFEKDHSYIVKKIRHILEENLEVIEGFNPTYTLVANSQKPVYELNRDAVMELVSTFTGHKALVLKRQLYAKVLEQKESNTIQETLPDILNNLFKEHIGTVQQQLEGLHERVDDLEIVAEEGDNYYAASHEIDIAIEIRSLAKAMVREIPHFIHDQFPNETLSRGAFMLIYQVYNRLHVDSITDLNNLTTERAGAKAISNLEFIRVNPKLHSKVYEAIDYIKDVIRHERERKEKVV